jgi:hypothetical protein
MQHVDIRRKIVHTVSVRIAPPIHITVVENASIVRSVVLAARFVRKDASALDARSMISID